MTNLIGALVTVCWIFSLLGTGVAGTVFLYKYIKRRDQEVMLSKLERSVKKRSTWTV